MPDQLFPQQVVSNYPIHSIDVVEPIANYHFLNINFSKKIIIDSKKKVLEEAK